MLTFNEKKNVKYVNFPLTTEMNFWQEEREKNGKAGHLQMTRDLQEKRQSWP